MLFEYNMLIASNYVDVLAHPIDYEYTFVSHTDIRRQKHAIYLYNYCDSVLDGIYSAEYGLHVSLIMDFE